jgi:hypothetical protein
VLLGQQQPHQVGGHVDIGGGHGVWHIHHLNEVLSPLPST